MDRAIEIAMGQSWIYNQSWEDPKVDVEHFKIGKGDRVCMLTTGGDNVLDYLIEDPEYIDTFDMNEHQNYLVDMKLACVKALSYDDCFAILAQQDYKCFQKCFPQVKRHLQSERSRQWWEVNQHRMKNWHLSGSVKFAAYTAIGILKLMGCHDMLEEMKAMTEPTLEKQREIYAKYRMRVLMAASLGQTGINGLIGCVGVPERQFGMYDDKDRLLPELLDFICQHTLLFQDNYFYSSYLEGGWTKKSCPRYLREEFFPLVKERANRVRWITATLADGVQGPEARKDYTRFVLLDHQDWLPEEIIVKSWRVLSTVGAKEGALVGWRSFGTLPFGCLSNLKFHVKTHIGRREPNAASDRVAMYNGLFCAELPTPEQAPYLLSEPTWKRQTLLGSFKTFTTMMMAPLTTMLSSSHSDFLESFYASQADDYDAYRANMLHGKRDLMWSVPWTTKPKRVLLFGGGTGDVLEYLADQMHTFEEVVVLDLCQALLNQAQKRSERHGWKNVRTVQGDATQVTFDKPFDVVISSYVFTMIPDWKKAIEKAWSFVAEGGYLAATDFTTSPRDQYKLSQWMWKKTFSFDHVMLNAEHHDLIRSLGTACAFRIESGGFPFVPLLQCPYYYAVQQKTA
eukprot:TRINITY_DN2510_c0_g1_i1.p1 TRINITY_DN2510_c0_g1~~TRINITY_DN2510_c0_g1_i1.p1  ORF type:complete len:625 (+),score=314.98 TRINITY_DN2510_c0_g1_i1:125-1999(+)